MLSTENRRLYAECFRLPEGYRLDFAVGTTFTLDFEAFLFVPIALSSAYAEEPEVVLRDPFAMLEAIQQIGHKVTVFCEDGRANAPELRHGLLALLEDSFVPVRVRQDHAVFHPKLWLLRYFDEEDHENTNPHIRAVVLSRNLSSSRSWDTVVRLEGVPNPRRGVPESRELANLLRALPTLTDDLHRISDERRQRIESLADEVERTVFAAPAPFDTETRASFVALGIEKGKRWRPESGRRILGISPFLSNDALDWLADLAPDRKLISREESLDALKPETIDNWQCYGLHEAAGGESQLGEDELSANSADIPHGLHAKALVIENGRRATWWLGSANLTNPVKEARNVELLVRLEGRTRDVGIDRFLDNGIESLLLPYQRPESQEIMQDDGTAEIEKAFRAIVHSNLQIECVETPGEGWTLRLDGRLPLPEGVEARLRPLTFPRQAARAWRDEPLEFTNTSTEELTAFIAFRLEAQGEGGVVVKELTRKLPISGLPEHRLDRVVRSMFRNRGDFLSYVESVLGGVDGFSGGRALLGMEERRRGAGDISEQSGGQAVPVLLESILRSLHQDPERLVAIDRVLTRLESKDDNEEEENILPPEFLKLWSTVRELIQRPPAESEPTS